MEKLKMHSANLTQDNIARIRDLFPGCITEAKGEDGSVKLAVDFDQLRQELAESIVEGPQERYHLNWPGKREALISANSPIAKTFRPCRAESVNFDQTQNIFIEGDNLDALKLLQESYLGKVKLIYIDPPYNTGNDFLYKDDFSEGVGEYLLRTNQQSESGQRLVANPGSNGRFHSDWASMMYSRLKISRSLLSDDGLICISIDDIEKANLRKICDEVFGEFNLIAEMVVLTGANQSGEGVKVQTNTEYCIVYCKDAESVKVNRVDKVEESLRNLNDAPTALETRPDMGYSIYFHPVTGAIIPLHDYDKTRIYLNKEDLVYRDDPKLISEGFIPLRPGFRANKLHRWRWGIDTFMERLEEVVIERSSSGKFIPKFRQSGFNAPKNILQYGGGATEVSELFDGHKVFDYPKSKKLIGRLLDIFSDKDSIVLDFFGGSGTTAHAVLEANQRDGGARRFIVVQLDEPTVERSVANALGYKSISDLCKERIRRAGKKSEDLNAVAVRCTGFRVLKIDTSNMADIYYAPDALDKAKFDLFVENIKPDRTTEDLLFQVMIDWGVDLALPIAKQTIQGKDVLLVDGNALAACFDGHGGVDEDFVKELAKVQPLRAVFRDAGFKDSSVKINVEQIFKLLSPATEVKCI